MAEMSQVVDYVERALGEGVAGIAMGRNLWGWGTEHPTSSEELLIWFTVRNSH